MAQNFAKLLSILIIKTLIISETYAYRNALKLRHVVMAARHGVRATHAIDPAVNKYGEYPMGMDELTEVGRQQAFIYGQYLKNYYKDYLTDNPREVYSRACYLLRCYDTAALILAGMYPPKGGFVWNKKLKWQPIQIFSFPGEHDLDLEFCGANITESFEYLFNEKGPPGFETIKDFIFFIANKTGHDPYSTTFFQPIIDNYFLRKWENLPIPDWAEENWEAMDWALRKFSFEYHKEYMLPHCQSLTELIADTLDKEIKKSERGQKKISVLGFHRKNFQGFFYTFNYDRMKLFPRFLASLIFELYEDNSIRNNTQYYVKLLYSQGFKLGGGYQNFQVLKVPRCGNPCRLETLTQIFRTANIDKIGHCFKKAKNKCML